MAGRRLVTWLLVIVVLVTGAVIVAPALVAWRVEAAIAQELPGTASVDVRVRTAPWRLIRGTLDRVEVEARRALLGEIIADQLSVRLRDVQLDLSRLMLERTLAVARVGDGEGMVVLGHEDVARFLVTARGVGRAVVTLAGGVVTIEGDVRVGTVDLRARLEGRLVVSSPTTVDLHVQTLTVSGVEIPEEIGRVLVSGLNPLITLRGIPLPVRIESVAADEGQVRIHVRVGDRT
jgi:hypothetical protein